jgi:predicted ATPase
LNPLATVDLRQLVTFLVDQPERENQDYTLQQFADWLFKETGGQPFFLTETLKSLLETGLLSLQINDQGNPALHISTALLEQQRRQDAWVMPSAMRGVIRARSAMGLTLKPAMMKQVWPKQSGTWPR